MVEAEGGAPAAPRAAARDEARRAVTERLEARRRARDRARVVERRSIAAALVSFFGGVFLVALAGDGLIPVPWPLMLALSVLVFGAAVRARVLATRARERDDAAAAWYDEARRRLDDDFAFGQASGAEYAEPEHAYASDLDVFGEASLFERLNACRTVLGRDALARLLKGAPGGEDARARQEAVRELADAVAWREELEIRLRALEGRFGRNPVLRARAEDATRDLLSWGATPTPPRPGAGAVALDVALGAAAVLVLAGAFVFGYSLWFFAPFYLLNYAILSRAADLQPLVDRFERIHQTLDAWSRVIAHVEGAPFRAPLLAAARERLISAGLHASVAIARLERLADRLSQRRNPAWAYTFDVIFLVSLHVRRALFAWKRVHGNDLGGWLETAARVEAESALAAYAAGVPDHAWPEISEAGPALEAGDLQHPLLKAGARVGNDFGVAELGAVVIVTGSNMSGKSTFLRSLGLAVVMARLGLPVAARAFRARPLDVVTCMRVHDSLARGSSHFHAEVTRLKRCLDAVLAGRPTLVLLDEILSGTNSRERHLGALAVLRSLSSASAVTLCSTHDLGLTQIKDELPERTRVVHFRDHVEGGRMAFDYRLREGSVPSTNALRVMRAVGIDVPE